MIKSIFYSSVTILICCLLFSCSSYKFEYIPTSDKILLGLSKSLSNNLKEDELYLSFTKTYKNSKIRIIENNEILFDSLISTDNKKITKTFKINKNFNVQIYIEGIKQSLNLTKEQMKDYKFIYIEKNKKKVVVEFNNGTKNFDGKAILD